MKFQITRPEKNNSARGWEAEMLHPIASLSHLLRLSFGVFLVLCSGCNTSWFSRQDSPQAEVSPVSQNETPPPSEASSAEPEFDVFKESVAHLVRVGWTKEAAEAVVELNQHYLRLIWESDPSLWKETLALWARLGGNPRAMAGLMRRPELASLLAGSLSVDSQGPDLILQALTGRKEDDDFLLTLFAIFPEPSAVVRLSKGISWDPATILPLLQAGTIEFIPFLLEVPEDLGENAEVYRGWVREVIDWGFSRKRNGDTFGPQRAIDILYFHGPPICSLLRSDPQFAANFRETYWPRFLNIVEDRACAELEPELVQETSGQNKQPSQPVDQPNHAQSQNIKTQGDPQSTAGLKPETHVEDSEPAQSDKEGQISREGGEIESEEAGLAVIRHLPWYDYVYEPRVWEYFHTYRDKGDAPYEVFKRYGAVAVELGLAPEYRDISDRVLDALLHGDQLVVTCLLNEDLRRNPLFPQLFRRSIPAGILANALARLASDPNRANYNLEKWSRLSDTALAEELGPPPQGLVTWLPGYGLYNLARKMAQGRDVGAVDLLWAAGDLLVFAPMGSAVGSASRGIGAAAKVTSGTARLASKVAARAPGAVARQALRQGAARQMGRFAAKQAGKVAASRALSQAAPSLVPHANPEVTHLLAFSDDILAALRWKGTKVPIVKRFSRYFMLQGGRLFIGPPSEHFVARFLHETAENAALEMGLNAASGIGQAMHDRRWREHLSAWWTAYYTGQADKIVSDMPIPDEN
jgi:hypothetical protein